eukprot:TRINITY_DN6567_c0_g1_i2.p1 TRINITY_DN6567_c0_g1~~TRINITY_DN6567_c0_g1_i2.p1  ORF type:complete len:279 (+),score=48.47 TRINITY_DN6567_c0_g1_i2:45-881(+)
MLRASKDEEREQNYKQIIENYMKTWTAPHQSKGILPFRRVRRIVKSVEGAQSILISTDAIVFVSRLCEMLTVDLTSRAWENAQNARRKTILNSDLINSVAATDRFDFAIDFFPMNKLIEARKLLRFSRPGRRITTDNSRLESRGDIAHNQSVPRILHAQTIDPHRHDLQTSFINRQQTPFHTTHENIEPITTTLAPLPSYRQSPNIYAQRTTDNDDLSQSADEYERFQGFGNPGLQFASHQHPHRSIFDPRRFPLIDSIHANPHFDDSDTTHAYENEY